MDQTAERHLGAAAHRNRPAGRDAVGARNAARLTAVSYFKDGGWRRAVWARAALAVISLLLGALIAVIVVMMVAAVASINPARAIPLGSIVVGSRYSDFI